MNITKIKRQLAKVGIGNPLNQLFYTSEEIKEMRKEGKIFTPGMKRPVKLTSFQEKHKGKYGIQTTSGIIVKKSFDTFTEAKEWADWNYSKAPSGVKVIKL